jgi:hypothetical protein
LSVFVSHILGRWALLGFPSHVILPLALALPRVPLPFPWALGFPSLGSLGSKGSFLALGFQSVPLPWALGFLGFPSHGTKGQTYSEIPPTFFRNLKIWFLMVCCWFLNGF